eukprot:scaffold113913_cov55-Cyclotella_meneghiniana.AAC.2
MVIQERTKAATHGAINELDIPSTIFVTIAEAEQAVATLAKAKKPRLSKCVLSITSPASVCTRSAVNPIAERAMPTLPSFHPMDTK